MKFSELISTLVQMGFDPRATTEENYPPLPGVQTKNVVFGDDYDYRWAMHFYINEQEEILMFYGVAMMFGAPIESSEIIPLAMGPKDVDLGLKEFLLKLANAEGDGGSLTLEDIQLQ